MTKKKFVNTPIQQPDPEKGAKIVGGRPRETISRGVQVTSASNTANADKSKGVEIVGGRRP